MYALITFVITNESYFVSWLDGVAHGDECFREERADQRAAVGVEE